MQYQPDVAPFYVKGWDSADIGSSRRAIAFALPVYRTGTFAACPQTSCAFFDLTLNGVDWFAGPVSGSSGTIVVSTLTAHNAVGTFSFIGVDQSGVSQRSVTNGAFNIKY